MKKPLVLLAACGLTALLLPSGLMAAKSDGLKPKALAKYDSNHNGKLDPEEFAAVRADFAKNPKGDLAKLDTNHDGSLSDEELAAATPPAGKHGKSEADRAEKRAKRGASKSSDTPAATPPATPETK